jgi:hypothetical protein
MLAGLPACTLVSLFIFVLRFSVKRSLVLHKCIHNRVITYPGIYTIINLDYGG